MRNWTYPQNDSKTLWIPNADEDRSIGRLMGNIQDHFGSAMVLSGLDIEYYHWTLEEPCSCCTGSGVFAHYYKVTIREERCPYTADLPVVELIKE